MTKLLTFYSLREVTPGQVRDAVARFVAANPLDALKPVHEASSYLKNWKVAANRYVVRVPSEDYDHLAAIRAAQSIQIGTLVRIALESYDAQNPKETASSGKSFVQGELFREHI